VVDHSEDFSLSFRLWLEERGFLFYFFVVLYGGFDELLHGLLRPRAGKGGGFFGAGGAVPRNDGVWVADLLGI
jgi:hypothetical protein